MTLSDFYNDYQLAVYIKECYETITTHTMETVEAQRIENILKYRIMYLFDCETVASEYTTVANTINKAIKRNILGLVETCRIIFKATDNDNLVSTHNQNKFNPIDNVKNVNDLPTFSDNVMYTDLTNYQAKISFLKDNTHLKEWERINESIVYTY